MRHSDVLEEVCSSDDEDDDDDDKEGDESEEDDEAVDTAERPYDRKDPLTGAPEPLAPALVTLSLLPRSQWQSLVHLEAIKARNRCGCSYIES